MARKWESNEPQRERDNTIHVAIPEMTLDTLESLPKHGNFIDMPPQTWEEKRQAIIAERSAAGIYDHGEAEKQAADGETESPLPAARHPLPAAPERISPDEAAYLGEVWAKRAVADGAAALAAGVMESYFRYLQNKYNLQDQDEINEQGVITRVAATASDAEAE